MISPRSVSRYHYYNLPEILTHIDHSEKMFFMRTFITVLIIIFNLQTWTKADDIRDFEIEGISIGESLMDHMNIKQFNIFKKTQYEYVHTFATISVKNENLNLYDSVSAYYKIKDKNKIIQAVEGAIFDQICLNVAI